MSLNVVIGLVGSIATILVVVGMILLTPQGVEPSSAQERGVPGGVGRRAQRSAR